MNYGLPAFYIKCGDYKIKLMAPNAHTAAVWAIKRYLIDCRPPRRLAAGVGVNEIGFETPINIIFPTEEVAYLAGFPNVFGLKDEIHDECFNDLDETGDLPF